MPGSSDPYTYPGTDVLLKIPGIREPQRLAGFEANATAARLVELDAAPLKGEFDGVHLRAIHRHLFQDVYSWAGAFRTVNISKGAHVFGAAAFVEQALRNVLLELQGEHYLRGFDSRAFARRAGFYISEINAIHPFRDGNGRVQREFIRELGIEAGLVIDWSKVAAGQMAAASMESFKTGDSSGLAALILLCTK